MEQEVQGLILSIKNYMSESKGTNDKKNDW
jgi:hypothetical protein